MRRGDLCLAGISIIQRADREENITRRVASEETSSGLPRRPIGGS